MIMLVASCNGMQYGCCNCKKPSVSVELFTDEQATAIRWIWNPLALVILIAHIGMIMARVKDGYLIGTPFKTIICTIAQIWTLLWIQKTIGTLKVSFVQNIKVLGRFVVGVMITRILIFSFN